MAEQNSIPQGTAVEWATKISEAVRGNDPRYNPERQALNQMAKEKPGQPLTPQAWAQYLVDHDPQYSATRFRFTDLGPAETGGRNPKPDAGPQGGRGGQAPTKTKDPTYAMPEVPPAAKQFWDMATTPLAEGLRKPSEKAAGWLLPKITPGMAGAPKEAVEFVSGFGEGAASAGVSMTSPANLGLMIGSAFLPETFLAKVPKLAKMLKGIAKTGFTGMASWDGLKEVKGAYEAYQKGDYRGVGKAVAQAVADATLIRTAVKGKAAGKIAPESVDRYTGRAEQAPARKAARATGPEPGGSTRPERSEGQSNPEHTAAALEAKRAADAKKPGPPVMEPPKVEKPTTPDAIEKRIGELQDKLNLKRGGPRTKERESMEAEIRDLRASHPQVARSEHLRGQRTLAQYIDYLTAERDKLPRHSHEFDAISAEIRDATKQIGDRSQVAHPEAEKPAAPPEPPTAITKESQQKRAEAAAARAKEPRKPVGDLGYRVAPEETGELPPRVKPISEPIGPEQPAPPPGPPAAPPELGTGTGAGEAQQFTAEKLPGVPKGSTVIFREQTPEGMRIDVVDPSGRTTPATLPFRDTIDKLTQRGWIKPKATPGETFEGQKPELPPEPPRANVQEIRSDTHRGLELPAPPAGTPGQKLLDSGPNVTPLGPPAPPPPPDASYVRAVPAAYPTPEGQPDGHPAVQSNVGPPATPTPPAAAAPVAPKPATPVLKAVPPPLKAPVKAEPATTPEGVGKKLAGQVRQESIKAKPQPQPPAKLPEIPKKKPAEVVEMKPKAVTPKAEPAPAAAGPAPSQELSQVVTSMFDHAKANEPSGYQQLRVKILNRAGKEIASELFDAKTPPEAVAQAIAQLKGVAQFKVEYIGGPSPKVTRTLNLNGRADMGKPAPPPGP